MASLRDVAILSCFLTLISAVHSQTCKSQTFTNNALYTHCIDLPSLSSYLHFTYDATNSTLSLAFIATPPKTGGWVSWALNPTTPKMAGARALVAYTDSNGSVAVHTYNISGYTGDGVVQGKVEFEVWDTRAEEASGSIRIFGKLKVPTSWVRSGGTVYHVWQVGPSVSSGGVLTPHEMSGPNFQATGTLDLSGGESSTSGGSANSRTTKRNIHGVLNAVSWGILFPVGVIVARYVRVFQAADTAWFYMHVSCQVSAYAIGVAGWATGLKLGSDSKGIQYSAHRNIGIALFVLATLQIFALFLRPKKEHKYRIYWKFYHHAVGYAIIVLGILNVFKGLDILHPLQKYRTAYIIVIAALGGVALLLEIITWIIVLQRKSNSNSTKPYE